MCKLYLRDTNVFTNSRLAASLTHPPLSGVVWNIIFLFVSTYVVLTIGRLLTLWVSFAEYSLFYRALLRKRPIILRSLRIVATQYVTQEEVCLCLMCTYLCTYLCVKICVYLYVYIWKYVFICMYIYIYMYINTCTYYTCTCIRIYICV